MNFEGCAEPKTPGMIRVSFGIYNTEEEVERLAEGIANIRPMMGMRD